DWASLEMQIRDADIAAARRPNSQQRFWESINNLYRDQGLEVEYRVFGTPMEDWIGSRTQTSAARLPAGKALTMGWVYTLGRWFHLSRRQTEIGLAPIVEAPIIAFVAALGWLFPSLEDRFISKHPGKDPERLRKGIGFVRNTMLIVFGVVALI